MDLKFEITVKGVSDEITNAKIFELLSDIKFRLEGYKTTPPKDISYNDVEIRYKKE